MATPATSPAPPTASKPTTTTTPGQFVSGSDVADDTFTAICSYDGSTAAGPNVADNPFHYLGQYQYGVDMLLGYRWYFPGWGRFLTPDPTGQEANSYAYAKNDPINNSDPTGSCSLADLGSNLGGQLGGYIAAGVTAAACASTAGLGCLIAGVVGGAALGAAIGGGKGNDIRDGFIDGAVSGATKGLGGGTLGKAFRYFKGAR